MVALSRVFVARLVGLQVLGPDGESIGRVRDVVLTLRHDGKTPRVMGLAVELSTRRRIFVPMLRVTGIEGSAITLSTGRVSLRRLKLRAGEALAVAQILESKVRVSADDPAQYTVTDLGMEQTRTRDWVVARVALRGGRSNRGFLGRRSETRVLPWGEVLGLTQRDLNLPGQEVSPVLAVFEDMRPADIAHELRDMPPNRRVEVAIAMDDERLADVLQELPTDDQTVLLSHIDDARVADILEAMDPDDAADLLAEVSTPQAERWLAKMDPQESEPVRRIMVHSPDTAGGLMTPEPIIANASTTVAEALARVRHPDITPAIASLVFVVRPPTATPTGKYLGCVHLQALLRQPPADLLGGILDANLPHLSPDDSLEAVARYFATYNLVCGPVIDDQQHLVGAVTVDDVLDHLLPDGWRETT